jgi:transcriptional antiterminator RfaH
MMLAPTARWYVVRTQPRAEAKALLNLDRQNFPVYWPRYLRRRRHARKIDTVAAPLFPSYLFVAVDTLTQRWRSIRSTFGVSELLCIGERPAPVPCGVVDSIKAREDERGFVRVALGPRFNAGDSVRVTDGVFTGCLGICDGMTDMERVAVLLELLGRKVRVVMDADLVAVA